MRRRFVILKQVQDDEEWETPPIPLYRRAMGGGSLRNPVHFTMVEGSLSGDNDPFKSRTLFVIANDREV